MSALFFSRDPGAANVVASLYHKLDGEKVFVAKDSSRNHLERFDVDYLNFNESVLDRNCTVRDVELIRKWLHSIENLSVIITGTTDRDDYTDRLIWQVARELSIPTIAVLDLCLRLKERFMGEDEELFRPDYILCPDARIEKTINTLQLARSGAVIIGRPYLADLYEQRSKWLEKREQTRKALKKQFNRDFDILVLFASEAQRTLTDSGEYCEIKAFELTRDATTRCFDSPLLLVKLHPREDKNAFKDIHSFVVQDEFESLPLVAASDIVVGIKSVLLIEGLLLERPTVSITKWDEEAKSFLGNELGITKIVNEEQELIQFLGKSKLHLPEREILMSRLFIKEDWQAIFLELVESVRVR